MSKPLILCMAAFWIRVIHLFRLSTLIKAAPAGDLAARQIQVRVDMVSCDTCFSAYVIGSVLPSSGNMAITLWQSAPGAVAVQLNGRSHRTIPGQVTVDPRTSHG